MKYQVLNHEYMNTGGNCMVSIFSLWCTEENRTVFLLANEEGCSLSTADYISNDIDYDDSMTIDVFDIHMFDCANKNFELYRDCWFEFIKCDCLRFGTAYEVDIDLLPLALFNDIPIELLHFMGINGQHTVSTDGVHIITGFKEQTFELKVMAFQRYIKRLMPSIKCNEKEQWSRLYDSKITITVCDQTIELPFSATPYNYILDMIDDYVENEL